MEEVNLRIDMIGQCSIDADVRHYIL